ncbi:UTRA domain-containing protein [Gluconobacter roseus]|uniref:UTRA domain-containing protein n=1 Tax=Gluconobacter roseus TaxID=586239 RepID=UPI0038CFE04B
MGFSEDMRARGYEPASIWLDKCAAGASPDEAMALSIAPAAPVLRLKRIRARMATLHEADLLHISPPTAILEIERRSFLPDGRVLEVTFSCYRADLYDFVVEF